MANQILRKPTIAVTPEQYKTLTEKYTPKPTIVKNVVRAFVVGGIICSIGQVIINLYVTFGLAPIEASTAATATMIFIGALLTGLGIYDDIGRFAGAGSIVPITGFANSIVSPAMEYKREGFVLGVGAKLFTVAGPVLVYGISTSIVVGIFYFFLH
jgi:stage V sporulation protein AC